MAFKRFDRKVGRSGGRTGGGRKRSLFQTKKVLLGPSYFPFCLILENNRYYLLKSRDKSHTKQCHVLSLELAGWHYVCNYKCAILVLVTLKKEHKKLNTFCWSNFLVFPWALFIYYKSYLLLFLPFSFKKISSWRHLEAVIKQAVVPLHISLAILLANWSTFYSQKNSFNEILCRWNPRNNVMWSISCGLHRHVSYEISTTILKTLVS